MLRVSIVGLVDDSVRITELLQDHGAVQVMPYVSEEPERRLSEITDLQAKALKADELASGLRSALDFMEKQNQVKKGALGTFIGWRYRVGSAEYDGFIAGGEAKARRIIELTQAEEQLIASVTSEIKNVDADIEKLIPWTSLPVAAAEFQVLKKHDFLFVSSERTRNASSLDEIVKEMEYPVAHETVSSVAGKEYSAIAVGKENAQEAARHLATKGFDVINLPEGTAPPEIEIKKLRDRKTSLESALEKAKADALKLVELRPEAFCLHDHYANEKSRYETAGGFVSTNSAFAIDGWIRKDSLRALENDLKTKVPSAAILSRPPEEGEDIPVDLINKGIMGPFESVTRIMGLPRQGTVDPTPLLAVFFFIYFGTCMGDVVYGVIMTVLGLVMLKKLKTQGMGTQLLQLLVVGGIATIVMGAAFGGYFGDLLSKYIKPLWFDPMSEQGPIIFLSFAFGMGVVQILFGMAIKAWDNARQGKWLSAIYDQGFWVLLLLGVGLLLGGSALGPGYSAAGKWMASAGALGLVLTQGRHQKSVLLKLGSGIVSLYNITSYMSDIVSYSRLFGLGFTSIVIGMVINYMAKMTLAIPVVGYVFFVLILVAGHMFNLFINITGAFIHSSRLQYVEFFGKFADFGGTKFTPFRRSNKYVDID